MNIKLRNYGRALFTALVFLTSGVLSAQTETPELKPSTSPASETTPAPSTETATTSAPAPSPQPYRNQREGFFIGFGLGGSDMNFEVDNFSFHKPAGGFDFRIGAGITEKLLLGAQIRASFTKLEKGDTVTGGTLTEDLNVSLAGFLATAQYFFIRDAYVRGGIGFGSATAEATVGGVKISTESKRGLFTDLTGGYEFRFWKAFALSPELTFSYAHIEDGNTYNLGGQLGFSWYL